MSENNHPETDWANIKKEQIIPILCEFLPTYIRSDALFTSRFLSNFFEASFRPVLSKIKNLCDALGKFQADAGKGYSIVMLDHFPTSEDNHWGLHLTLINAKEEQIGAIRVAVGLPVEINVIQGHNGQGPQAFFQRTGTHFDEALVGQLIALAGQKLVFEKTDLFWKEPKLIVKPRYNRMPINMKRRIAHHYLQKSLIPEFCKDEIYGKSFPIRPKFFASARREAEKQRLPSPAKQLTLIR